MTPQGWDRVKRVFFEAAGLRSDELAQYLEHACGGDVGLRAEVERLLQYHKRAGDFLEEPLARLAGPPAVSAHNQPHFSPGDVIADRFVIEGLLGAGGMGEVYRARDRRLQRRVALKLLAPHLFGDAEGRHRLEREARAVAKLSHPHICPLLHFDTAAGQDYLVLEYLEGETLASRLRAGPMALVDAKRIAEEVATALGYAHARGVIHRDLKPGNIMLTAEGAKLLDFGLARTLTPLRDAGGRHEAGSSTATTQTREGKILGTASYMSPEQAEGAAVDARTDVFSFGCVLYEMLTGRRAFAGSSAMSTIAAILRSEPEPVRTLVPNVPDAVCAVVERCMRKDPAARYQTMDEVAAALRNDGAAAVKDGKDRSRSDEPLLQGLKRGGRGRARTVVGATALILTAGLATIPLLRDRRSPTGVRDSIVVLPFVNAARNPEIEYLADGLSESLTNAFSRVPELRVIARTTAFRYKGRELDIPRIGRELKVRAVVTGSISERHESLRIQTDLVDAIAGTQVWGEQYEGTAREALRIQEDIVTKVAERLRIPLSEPRKNALATPPTRNPEAYRLYLKGRHVFYRWTPVDLKQSIEFFRGALAVDPGYASAYAGLADAYSGLSAMPLRPSEAMPRARAAAQRALELDPYSADAHVSMTIIAGWYDFDWAAADRHSARALQLSPNNAAAHLWRGVLLTTIGREREGIEETRRAHDLDPLSPFIETGLGQVYFLTRQYDAAITRLRNVGDLNPDFLPGRLWLGVAYLHVGNYERAIDNLEQVHRADPSLPQPVGYLAYAFAKRGDRARALAFLNKLREVKTTGYTSPFLEAVALVGLGDHRKALDGLEEAYREREDALPWLRLDSLFDPLRSEPRFKAVLRRLGLEQH